MALGEVTTSGSRLKLAGPPAVSHSRDWGWLPTLSVVAAFGSAMSALAYTGGRMDAGWAVPLLWISPLIGVAPAALRLFSSSVSRHERIGILIVIGIMLDLIKALQYPLAFQETDALRQWRTAQDIAATHHLFQFNPVMTISPWYPGLAIVANAISDLSGISIYHAEVILIGVARLLLILSLYLFFEHVSGSGWMAGIATFFYMANPHYVYFDGTLSYESLGLPLCAFVLFAISSRLRSSTEQRTGMTLAIWLGMGALVITHHLTSYALVAFLILWTAVSLYGRWRWRRVCGIGGPALLGLAMVFGWSVLTGFRAAAYLGNTLDAAESSIIQTLSGSLAPRQLFTDYSGAVTPLPERVLVYSAVVLTVIGIAFALPHVWRYHRTNATALLLGLVAVGYPVSQVFRFTAYSGEVSDRATEFVFVGVAFVLACGATHRWLPDATDANEEVGTWRWLLGEVSSLPVVIASRRWLRETAYPAITVAHRRLRETVSPIVTASHQWLRETGSSAAIVAQWWLMDAMSKSRRMAATCRWLQRLARRKITAAWHALVRSVSSSPTGVAARRWQREMVNPTVTATRRWLRDTVTSTITSMWRWLREAVTPTITATRRWQRDTVNPIVTAAQRWLREAATPFVTAAWYWLRGLVRFRRMAIIVSALSILFLGMMLAGSGPPWYRMPGPYLVSADVRSITPEGIAAAEWAGTHLGTNQRIATDRVDTLLQATYGHEWPVTSDVEHIPAELLFTSPSFGPAERAIAQEGDIRYLVVDTRLSSGLPRIGYYFTKGEPNAFKHTKPIDPAALTKFDYVPGISRLYDSGNIAIYDVGGTYGNP